MKTMYSAKATIEVCFVIDGKVKADNKEDIKYLRNKAIEYISEEISHGGWEISILNEIVSEKDIPNGWDNACYYGQNTDETVKEFLFTNTEENKKAYELYLELKARFE